MNRSIRTLLTGILFLSFLSACAGSHQAERGKTTDPDRKDWIVLFNGQNLDGWIPKIAGYPVGMNFGNTFRTENGEIRVAYDQYEQFNERFGHLFYDTPYSYYRLALDYRFVGDQLPDGPGWAFRNSGIMIHGQPPETMGKDQDFPISIEVQLLGGSGDGERTTSNLCTPGTNVVFEGTLDTRHCISSTSQTYNGDRWVHAEVLVLGDSLITHFVEGSPVLSYTHPQIGGGNVSGFVESAKKDGAMLTGGSISLQSESHPVAFRNIRLLPLIGCMDPKATNYKSYYVKSEPGACRF